MGKNIVHQLAIICPLLLMVTSLREPTGSDVQRASKALARIMDRNQNDQSWIENIPRISLVHEIARFHLPRIENVTLIAKRLNAITAVELLKEIFKRPQEMSAVKTAHLVNALKATCQNPRNFHGHDLLAELRGNKDREHLVSPYVHLTLCVNGLSQPEDANSVYRAIANKDPDMMSIGVLALMCILPKYDYGHLNHTNGHDWNAALYNFFNKSVSEAKANYLTDVYTTALTLQMLNCVPKHWKLFSYRSDTVEDFKDALRGHQRIDGSFGDFLSTYYAIPAILGHCVLDPNNFCSSRNSKLEEYSVEYVPKEQLKKVTYSLWIRGGPRNSWTAHSKAFSIGRNNSLFDLMNYAKSESHLFNFSYDEDAQGKHVYSISNIPNDSEKGYSWGLFVNDFKQIEIDDDRNLYSSKLRHYINMGVDKTPVHEGDKLVFLYSKFI